MSDTPKAISSLAKKQQDVTRQGTQKLKFVPILPSRRKKDETKAELSPPSVSVADTVRNEGVGKGRGRGIQRKPVEMTASGPFAMGPASSSPASRRPTPRFDAASSAMSSTSTATSKTTFNVPSLEHLNLDHRPRCLDLDEDEELFSEPDEGIEVIDLQSVQRLDWTAPESLRRSRKAYKERQDEPEELGSGNMSNKSDELHIAADANVPEDLILELSTQSLFSIQFPTPFPTFSLSPDLGSQDIINDGTSRGVGSGLDIKPPTVPGSSTSPGTGTEKPNESKAPEIVDGVIGQLELFRSGVIRIRMANGIMFDMKSATQLAFPEQAIILNRADNRLIVLGEIDKRYIASPDVDALLAATDVADRPVGVSGIEEELIAMDTT